MAKDNDGLFLTASLNISQTADNIKEEIKKLNNILANDKSAQVKIIGGLDLNETQSLIQSQIATIGKNLKLNIGQIDTSELNNSVLNIKNKVFGTNDGLVIKPSVDGKAVTDIENLIKQMVSNLQKLGAIDLTSFKKNLRDIYGFSGNEVSLAANELVQALKLTPNDQQNIINSYEYLMDNIRNTIKNDSIVSNENFDNNLAMAIYKSATEYKNLENTAISTMAKVKMATENVVSSNNQIDSSVKYISTEYKTSFDVVSDVIRQAKSEFERFGTVSVNSNKAVKAIDGIPEHFKDFTIQVKSATGEIQKFLYTFENTGSKDSPVFQYMLQNINEADAGVKKLADDIAKAKAEYTSKLTGFESTNSQIKSGLSAEIANVRSEIDKLGTSDGSIQNLKVVFSDLTTSANKIKENLKATGASLNPVDNAINKYKDMDNIINDLSNKFKSLKVVPSDANSQIDGLKAKFVELQNIEQTQGRNETWAVKYHELAVAVKEAETNVKKLQLAEKSGNSSAQQQTTYYGRIFENEKLIFSLKKKLLTAGSEETAELQRQITNAQKRINYSEQQLKKKQLITVELTKQRNELVNLYSEELKIANLSTKDNMLSGIDKTISRLQSLPNQSVFLNNSQNNGVKQLQTDVQNLVNKYDELRTKIQSLNGKDTNATVVLRQEMLSLATELDKVNVSAKNLKSSISADNSMQRQAQNAELLVEKVKKLRSEIIAYQNANSKAMKSKTMSSNGITYSAEIDNLLAKLKNASNLTDAEFKKISANFRSLRAEIKSVGLEGGTIFSNLWTNIKKFSSWMSMTSIISTAVMDIRNAVNELKEIDTILTEISKTSDRTTESLAKLGATAFDTASKYGQKASDYLTGIQEMSRAGFGEAESERMAELSTLAQSAGDMTAELANSYLIATNAAYGLNGNAEKLNDILDRQNFITNRNAVNMSELAEATKIAGSQAAQSGISTAQLTAMLGTMIATTQQGGEVASRAAKGIIMNLQQVTAEADEIGDGGEAITSESLTKYEKACADLGVSLKTVKDGVVSLRDPMQTLEELSIAVSNEAEGSVKVANLINAVGGKYRGNQLSALLNNWDTYKKMLSEFNSDEAVGSAAEEAQKTAESWEGMFNALENDWTKFVSEFANSDLFKSLIESTRRFIDVLSDTSSPLNFILTQVANIIEMVSKLTDTIGLIPTVLAGLSLKNVGEQNLKYARFRTATIYKYGECNTFQNKVIKLLGNAKAV